MKYRADIDGLRALAVVPVLFYHAGVPGVPGGFVGVDIFFVISGYVITARLNEDLLRSKFSILDFYERRIRRIFPALLFVIALTWIAAWFLLLPTEMLDFSKSLAAAGYFASNFFFWNSSGYFDAASTLRPALHTWSLAVEEQFYIFMPVAMYLGVRFIGSYWKLLVWFAAIASFGLSVALQPTAPTATFFLLPTRAWELLLGSLLILTPLPKISRLTSLVGGMIGLLLIAYAVVAFNETTPFPGLNALYPCLGAAILIFTQTEQATLAGRLLSLRPFVSIGLISYSLYLIHWPLIVMSRYFLVRGPQGAEILAIIIASFALAAISFRFVETPFRKQKDGASHKYVFSFAIFSLIATFTVGSVGIHEKGFPSRFPDYYQQEATGGDELKFGRCFLSGQPIDNWDASLCTLNTGHKDNLLLWGDSFAAHYAPGILRSRDILGVNVIQYTSAGCPPLLSYYSYRIPLCTSFNARALDLIKEHNVRLVVLSARWDLLGQHGADGFQKTIETIRSLGAKVVVIGQSPQFGLDVHSLAYRLRSNPPVNGISSWKTTNYNPTIEESLRAQSVHATFIEPIKELCDGDVCPYLIDGRFLFSDYGHFSAEGSEFAVRKYFPRRLE
jgi:peptidoglycan/LPS O-acetylase OafA/YrhL